VELMLTIRDIMTQSPRVIEARADSAVAVALMDEHDVRHLPVVDDEGRLVGVLSERDLRRARALLDCAPGEVGPEVVALCSTEVLSFGPDEPIEAATAAMADRKLGSAVVVDAGEVLGIVTCVDVCRCVTQLVTKLRARAEP
jgi:acetoin utilization protein AcuB